MIKLLYFTGSHKNYLHEYREYFKTELLKQPDVDVRFWTEEGHIKDIIAELDFKPDFIYFDDIIVNKPIKGLSNYDVPVGLLYHDLHSNQGKFRKITKEYQPSLIFVYYRDYFLRQFPEYQNMYVWLPHFVQNKIFKDYHLNKDIDYLLMGKINRRYYPLRFEIVKKMRESNHFVYHKHPGYKYFTRRKKARILIGRNYTKEINKAKIFFTDDLIYKYPIKKYFEVPACNTLLLAPGSQELRDLGFKDGDTFVEINSENFQEKQNFTLIMKRKDLK